MNWISGLQKAFDYIESHLTEDRRILRHRQIIHRTIFSGYLGFCADTLWGNISG